MSLFSQKSAHQFMHLDTYLAFPERGEVPASGISSVLSGVRKGVPSFPAVFYALLVTLFSVSAFAGNSVSDAKQDRILGSLMGLAVGDAFGVAQEVFIENAKTLEDIQRNVLIQRADRLKYRGLQTEMEGGGPWDPIIHLEPGEFTDDTSMALCLADSLISKQELDPSDLMERFVRWWNQGENAARFENKDGKLVGMPWGLGCNVGLALRRFEEDKANPIQGGTDPNRDAGNGAIMRLAPVAMYYHDDINLALKSARLQASTTHNVEEARDASAYLASILIHLYDGESFEQAIEVSDALALTHSEILELASPSAAWRTMGEDQVRTLPGRTLWTLEAALWIVHHTQSYEEAIIKAANLGGDADTVAAVTGQIAGALYGEKNIPQRWLSQLVYRDKIRLKGLALIEKTPFSEALVLP